MRQIEENETVLGTTESVCPECLRRIEAARVAAGDRVYLVKNCPEHGNFQTLIWQGRPFYHDWANPKLPVKPSACATAVDQGCPFDCGLCPEHRQETCCVLLEVTQNCNLTCPVCFAAGGGQTADPDMNVIRNWYQTLLDSGGPYNIQLSGGEPTLRDDLPEIICLGQELGFSFIQVNTNGLRLAEDAAYVKNLKTAGLSCVFLQFDGLNDAVYERLRGRPLLEIKKQAIEHCAKYGLGVVLVPTLVPGVNSGEIGAIIRFAIDRMPIVRGVHFQPISYFGRYPNAPSDADRMTIPEILAAIEYQTQGRMLASHFRPAGAENAYCSFNGSFMIMPDGKWKPMARQPAGCCQPRTAAQGAKQAREYVARQWKMPGEATTVARLGKTINIASLDNFLSQINAYTLAISGMAFQDAWNLDVERLKDCFIHVVSPEGKIIPFCAYNLTDRQGRALYRGRSG